MVAVEEVVAAVVVGGGRAPTIPFGWGAGFAPLLLLAVLPIPFGAAFAAAPVVVLEAPGVGDPCEPFVIASVFAFALAFAFGKRVAVLGKRFISCARQTRR